VTDEQRRMQYAVVHFGKRCALHIMQLYGRAEGGKPAEEFNASLVLAAAAWLRSLGDVPALIVGDLNVSLANTAIDAPLAMAGWVDVLASAGPTCIPSVGAPSRIDYVIASRPAAAFIKSASIRWDLGLATHAALLVDMEVEAAEKTWMRRLVQPLSGPQAEGWPEQRARATDEVMGRHAATVRAALADGNLDVAWASLERAMREWLSRRQGDGELPERQHARAEWRAEAPRASGPSGEAKSCAADAALLRVRRLRAFRHASSRILPACAGGVLPRMGCAPRAAEHILAALRRADRDQPEWSLALEVLTRDPGAVIGLLERAEVELREVASQDRQRRKDAWHKWVTDALEDGGGRLYRWIRGGAATAADMVPDPSVEGHEAAAGSKSWLKALRGGPAAQLRCLQQRWCALWQRQCEGSVPEQWLQELDGLPPFPARTPWTVAYLRDLLRRMARRKAVGLDGWSVMELRLLPDELLGLVAELFEGVEELGRWPTRLSEPEGLLLPKDGGADPFDPMNRRPIWLLPMLYRLWAAGRAQIFARWRAAWPGGDGQAGAEELAWELAMELETAEALGETIAGAALDWMKAFDNIPLQHLEPVLARAGVPRWIRGPLVVAYTSKRRLRVDGALGDSWHPTSGVLPGCALAVFVLSVLIRPWDRRCERVDDTLRRRIYVDDLTLWARGCGDDVAPLIVEGLKITRDFEAAMGWRLHTGRGKSAQFANSAEIRKWLSQQTPAVEVRLQIRDLGVVAVAGRQRRAPVSAARIEVAVGRFGRIARIPVPFKRRCHLGAAAGTAAGVYGAVCGPPPAHELEKLRRAARAAVCHGGIRAAPELVFGMLSPTWRLDPKAVSVVAPVFQAVKALRANRLPDSWGLTANAVEAGRGRAVGPVAATLRSMALLGLGSDVSCWRGVPRAPQGWKPAEHPKKESLQVLLEAWRKKQWADVAQRRQDFAHLANGVDKWATMRLLEGGVRGFPQLTPDASGALRTVISGNVVTERVAAHWTDQPTCPHCGIEVEDREHRFWRCPAWESARTQALGAPGASMALRTQISDGLARSGVLEAQPQLIVLAEAAERADPQLPDVQPVAEGASSRTIWSDGSCVHPLDPLLARAAWGLRIAASTDGGSAGEHDLAGPVGGAQTAQRAEVTASLAAVRAVREPVDLVTDSKYVVRSVARLAAGESPSEWRHADLWGQLEPHVRAGRLRARWTPAHKTAEEYARRGLAEIDRVGNDAADVNAGAASVARLPPMAIMQRRLEQVLDVAQAQRVIALTELAALRANHASSAGAPRVKRRWGDVRRGARSAGNRGVAPAETPNRPRGALPAPLHDLVRDGATLKCAQCCKSAVKARWAKLAYGRCALNAIGEAITFTRVPHQPLEENGSVGCLRCGGRVPAHRRSAFIGKQCPAWQLVVPESQVEGEAGDALPDWGAWIFALLGHRAAGVVHGPATSTSGAANEQAALATPVTGAEGIRALFAGGAWRAHVAAQGPNFSGCLVCGDTAPRWQTLQATPCKQWRAVLPPRVAALVLLGDGVMRVSGPPIGFAAALAARRGERPRPPE
jgi:ribonuclease HI